MELTFNKVDNQYESEFEVTGDFNLHVEGVLPKNTTIYQKTAGNRYDVVRGFPQMPPLSNIIDFDFAGVIYPKYIKVVSDVQPTLAVVTFAE